jgi:hypothetical protein
MRMTFKPLFLFYFNFDQLSPNILETDYTPDTPNIRG